jgi:hypothetical protein
MFFKELFLRGGVTRVIPPTNDGGRVRGIAACGVTVGGEGVDGDM